MLAFAAGGVRVAKIGQVRLQWSRDMSCEPSGVTVIREGDGRHEASFAVQVATTALPPTTNEVGIGLGGPARGLSTGEIIDNPRHLRGGARALACAQRGLSTQTKGSKRAAKVVRRLAVQHRKVAETGLDAHHKLAHPMVRDNHVIYLPGPAVSAPARTRAIGRCQPDSATSTIDLAFPRTR
jgi:putative transposase